ncbi:DNA gyrase inhibitor YacG [Allosphingosinicella sp.]|uniref:DNA gyrase inhibitor YacG n=1 Tax=Allosphingosinicella sp. TaxID=2823234 RepID=UPI003D76543B
MPPKSKKRRDGCPLCGKPPSVDHAPFCGQGCRDRDLLNWLGDGYRVPGPPADEGAVDFASDGLDSER